jgi:hypothetical protein
VPTPARAPAPPGFLAFLAGRPLAVPTVAFALVAVAWITLRPGPGVQVAHRSAEGGSPFRPAASPIVEEPAVDVGSLGPAVRIARLEGTVQAFDEGTWKDLASGAALKEGQRLQSAAGARATLALPDGSRLEVAADTELVPFAERVRLRRGSVRFDVQHRPERIFRVLVPDGEVRVLGTLFDVGVKPAGTRVHLLHGRVEVQCGAQVVLLADGDSATIGGGRLAHIAASGAAGDSTPAGSSEPSSGESQTSAVSEAAVPPDAPVVPGPDPRPAVEATAASGPAPAGLR